MSQRKGLHAVLEIPFAYELVQRIFRHQKSLDLWADLIGDFENKTILDVGCGPGNDAPFFKDSKQYIGIDMSEQYIDFAKKNFSDYGDFYCLPIEKVSDLPLEKIDLVLMKGVFHHLSDEVIKDFLINIKRKMAPNGRVCSMDPCFFDNKFIANTIVSMDRGKFVRRHEDLRDLVSKYTEIKSQTTLKQHLPPYHRTILELV